MHTHFGRVDLVRRESTVSYAAGAAGKKKELYEEKTEESTVTHTASTDRLFAEEHQVLALKTGGIVR